MVPLAVADVFSAGHQPPWPRKPDDISAQNKHSKKWKIPMFLPCQQLDEDWLCTSSTAPIHIVDFHNKKKTIWRLNKCLVGKAETESCSKHVRNGKLAKDDEMARNLELKKHVRDGQLQYGLTCLFEKEIITFIFE